MQSKILKAQEASGHVLDYEVKALQMPPPEQALVFVHKQVEGSGRPFELNKLVAQSIGVDEIEKKSFIDSDDNAPIESFKEKAFAALLLFCNA